MNPTLRILLVAFLAFATPISLLVGFQWSEYRPLFIGDPATARGELHWFARRN